ncbi:stress protein [Alteromonas halophila]|uniref:Stress protein n=1 Tax=Alteromonas halophila TaxID=516698 RepID=A0A918MYN0_9ALTE|nr:stress protein [Alteromonas halophila]GGW88723.1 hypothetical protein GCM10007391_23680 [Alteromonas halophila]
MGNNQQNQDDDGINRALRGDYHFNIKSVLGRANTQLKQHFAAMLQASVILFVVLVGLSLILATAFDITEPEGITPTQRVLFQIAGVLVMAPLQTGLYMMGSYAARGNDVRGFHVFTFLPQVLVLALAQLLASMLTQLGLGLLIIPGVYLWVATVFTLPLVADKGLRPLSALIVSIKTVNRHIGHMLALMGILLLLFATAIPTYGLSLIWVLPFYFSTIGLLYNDLFGPANEIPATQAEGKETSFDA